MNSLSRVVSLITAAVLASTVVAGCSDDEDNHKKSDQVAADARVQACRVFTLGGGADGASLLQDLRAIEKDGSYEPAPLLVEIRAVRDSAAEAGKTAALSQDDFNLFRAVVDATASAQGDAGAAIAARGIDSGTTQAVTAALGGVQDLCA